MSGIRSGCSVVPTTGQGTGEGVTQRWAQMDSWIWVAFGTSWERWLRVGQDAGLEPRREVWAERRYRCQHGLSSVWNPTAWGESSGREPSRVGAAVVLEACERKKLRGDPKLASRWWSLSMSPPRSLERLHSILCLWDPGLHLYFCCNSPHPASAVQHLSNQLFGVGRLEGGLGTPHLHVGNYTSRHITHFLWHRFP